MTTTPAPIPAGHFLTEAHHAPGGCTVCHAYVNDRSYWRPTHTLHIDLVCPDDHQAVLLGAYIAGLLSSHPRTQPPGTVLNAWDVSGTDPGDAGRTDWSRVIDRPYGAAGDSDLGGPCQ